MQGGEDTDTESFERMYADCYNSVQRFCYFKLPSKIDGDDILQEVALSAWSHRESVRNADSFKPWLLQIAANKIRDFYRRRVKQLDVSLEDINELVLADSRFGITVEESVRETLDSLGTIDKKILNLAYIQNVPQAEIARRLNIPIGTVKSRLYTARGRFKNEYPYQPKKGENKMGKLPTRLPDYSIVTTAETPFECKWEELQGWLIIPKLGESLIWAMYDMPGRKINGEYKLRVTGRSTVHGVEGVAITAEIRDIGVAGDMTDVHDDCSTRDFVAQLTDTHVRFLAESHIRGDVKHYFTFLDGDAFLDNWGFGEDNCGNSIYPKRKGAIKRDGALITCHAEKFVLDVIDRCIVTIGGKEYDTIRVMDIECYNTGVASEQYLDRNGRTILWRRFNRDDWHYDFYKQKWSEKLPDNERLAINGETYVHWYDCISDYIL